MGSFSIIRDKLETFIKKYYTNELIKGVILFFAIGLLYFLVTLLVEYFLWLSSFGRALLFWTVVIVELALFIRFIVLPISQLLKLRKGIDYEEASMIIGNHFPEVSDKLLNVIQLNHDSHESELLAASIDQKARELEPIPFQGAVNFKGNSKYLKYAAIPILVFILFYAFWGKEIFSSSYTRVVNYDTAYEPPAPFSFVISNKNLKAIEGKPFKLEVHTVGETLPENASIFYNGETYYMQQNAPGSFEFTFQQPLESIDFRFSANKVNSRVYELEVIKTPSLVNFEMQLNFPGYTNKAPEILNGTGNALVPEGTSVKWKVVARNTEAIGLKTGDTVYGFKSDKGSFHLEKRIFNKMDYAISTSNSNLTDYENLNYTLNVIKDEYPEIEVESAPDSLNIQRIFFMGRISDDYGLTKLRLVYYPEGKENEQKYESLPLNKTNFDQFTYIFPANLELSEGVSYEYYFEVFDNDVLHNFKSSRSGIYNFQKLTTNQIEDVQLENQQKAIQGLDKSLEGLKNEKEKLEEISRLQKEKNELNFNDRKKLENFLKRQQRQDDVMKEFSKKLKDELENFQPERPEDQFKEQLEKRLDENEERLKENEKLLEELKKLQEKIQKEELTDKLEKLAKQNKKQEKNLEQLLELTKRYYVEKKAEKLAEELFKLGEEQERMSEKPETDNTKEEQEKLNKAFDDYKKQKEELIKENEDLKKPLNIPEEKSEEMEIDSEQEKATEKLENQDSKGASPSQKKAGQKMKQMGQQMKMQMQSGQMETLDEDIKMLRQILENLVVFSFRQEQLMNTFKTIQYGNPVYGKMLNVQNELKLNFEHIDDSLFALALRNPMIGNEINSALTDVQFNIQKSLDRLSQNDTRQGTGSQEYTMMRANDLAVLLDISLSNMQMQLQVGMGSGSGKGAPSPGSGGQGDKGFQLPDIIKKQEELGERMEKGMEKGKKEGEGSEGEGNDGDDEGDGDNGKTGKNGDKGNKSGEGQGGDGEEMNGELFEIYKQQQELRERLKDLLQQQGLGGAAGNLLKRMEGIEQQLLDKGFNNQTLEQMKNLKHELLKLDKALLEQGEENRRESNSNKKVFKNEAVMTPEEIKKYFNTTEILNREALPLRQDYKNKVQEYFKNSDD